VDLIEQLYDTCVMMKQKRLSFPRQASFWAKDQLARAFFTNDRKVMFYFCPGLIQFIGPPMLSTEDLRGLLKHIMV
jgi:hypothetical protein